MDTPKYTRIEYERRFLVDTNSDWRRTAKPYSRLLTDRYLDCGRLRVRRLEDSDTGLVTFKLTKKFESCSMFALPIVSIRLSPDEYEALIRLPGRDLSKRRYYSEYSGLIFSIDMFHGPLESLSLCETESESIEALREVCFPEYARWEVTEDPYFAGGSLCRADQPQLQASLRRYFESDAAGGTVPKL